MVFIVLVNWKGAYDTIRCLESIFRSSYKEFKVIVVDNHSQDDSLDVVRAWAERKLSLAEHRKDAVGLLSFPPIDIGIPFLSIEAAKLNFNDGVISEELIESIQLFIVSNSENSGFGAGNNVGLKLAKLYKNCRYFWLLNNDTVIREDTLDKLVRYSNDNPKTVVGSILRYYNDPNIIQVAGGGNFSPFTGIVKSKLVHSNGELDFINGASFFSPIEYYNEIGGFDENIFMYFEENEYCIRGKKVGFTFRCSDAIVFHRMGGSKYGSERAWQQQFKNKYYTMRKHFGFGYWLIFYVSSIIINATVLNRNIPKRLAAQTVIKSAFRPSKNGNV